MKLFIKALVTGTAAALLFFVGTGMAHADKEAAAKAEAEEDEVLPPLPADVTPAGPPPARFNPTEKVRADFPVSFPIDI